MTRQERLEFCKICQKRNADFNRGILCSLTNEYAAFENKCENFELDERVKALEAYKKEQATVKVQKTKNRSAKKRKVRGEEQLTKADLYLMLGFALFTTFVIRLILYINFTYNDNMVHLNLYMIVFASVIPAVLFRKSEQDRNWFFSDLKFKILFASMVTFFVLIYQLILHGDHQLLAAHSLSFLIISSLFCILSSVLIIPLNLLIQKIKPNHA